jgi:Holliday junction resolvase RusA-like endonuclease
VIELVIPGEPKGKGRPKFVRATGRAFTPKPTRLAEEFVRQVWMRAGSPRLDEGPLAVEVEVVLARPQGHRRRDGSLGAVGLRSPWPTKRPDWDNVAKLVADSLNGLAYRDDAQIVDARVVKRWAGANEVEHTRIVVTALELAA